MAAKKNILDTLGKLDTSYLLDPSVLEQKEPENSGAKEADRSLPVADLVPFQNHPFHIETESSDFKQLKDSIAEYGIIYPVLVRPLPDGKYEILSGHCRVEAAKECGMEEVPVRISDADDALATILMAHSNISGRDKIRISEKAKAYRMCMDSMKHQGASGEEEDQTAKVIGAGKDSERTVYRYVRLSYLTDDFLQMLDDGSMTVNVGYELAFLDHDSQVALMNFIHDQEYTVNPATARDLHKLFDEEGTISYEKLISLLIKPKKEAKPANRTLFKTSDLAEYFDEGTDEEKMKEVIVALLDKYRDGEIEL